MILEVRSSVAIALGVLRFVVLAFATLVISHDAVYFQTHGPAAADALDTLGHAAHRPVMVLVAAIAATVLIAWSTINLANIWMRLQRTGANRRIRDSSPSAKRALRPTYGYGATLVRLWTRQALVVIPAFVIQENLEHLAVHGAFPGFEILVGPNSGALPTLFIVIGAVSAIGALVRWQIARLHLRFGARAWMGWRTFDPSSPPARTATITALLVRHRWLIARRTTGRAPPVAAA